MAEVTTQTVAPGSDTAALQIEGARRSATEGVRVRLLVAIPVLILLVVATYGGVLYVMVQLEFENVSATHLNNFAGDWLRTLIGFVVVSCMVGFYLAYTITAPIKRMIRLSEKVAEGDFFVPAAAEAPRGNEVGALSQSFDHMIGSINRFVQLRSRYILESFSGGLITLDMHGTVTAMNSSAEKILGMRADSCLGHPVDQVLSGRGYEPLYKVVREALWKREPMVSRKLAVEAPGGPKRLSLNVAYMRDENGRIFGVIVNFRDQSELERFYEQMSRTERLAALGTFSAGLAHEILNPLGAIKAMTQLLSEDLKGNPRAREYASIIVKEANRLDELVREVREFSSPTTSRKELSDINQIVRETVVVARNNSKAVPADGVDFEEQYDAVPATMLSPDTIRQALLNILVNSIQATPPNETISIFTRFQPADPLPVQVVLCNTGSTISPDVLAHIFEPFYTTKESGTGLGLSISHQIIRQNGGDVTVDPGPSSVTFTVKLPLTEESDEPDND